MMTPQERRARLEKNVVGGQSPPTERFMSSTGKVHVIWVIRIVHDDAGPDDLCDRVDESVAWMTAFGPCGGNVGAICTVAAGRWVPNSTEVTCLICRQWGDGGCPKAAAA